MTGKLIELIPSFDVISFDIFDTLLLRPLMNPQDVWRMMECEEGAKGFANARREADAKSYTAATKRGGETTIDEAYALMPKWVEMKSKELECEDHLLIPNSEVVELWHKAGQLGKKRVIVSDMYLPAAFIKKLLLDRGIDGWDGFYLSSERGVRKATGELFKVMLGDMKVTPERVMHIGDNRQSDVIVPERLGIASFECVKVRDRLQEQCPFVAEFLRERPSLAKERLAGALSVGWHRFVHEHPAATYWNKLGFMLGGVLGFMYVDWVVKVARRKGIDHLMFVGRDGYVWQKICRVIAPDIKTDYFYAPRTISIRVNGAVGNDPGAVKDRQRYITVNRLTEVEGAAALKAYREYLQGFSVSPDKTALVDGCSSGFSAQRLVETAVGTHVFTFYLVAMARVDFGAALYSTELYPLFFQNFSEFVFGSPEPPVLNIVQGKVVFNDDPSIFERIKMSCSEPIAEGAVECAKELYERRVVVAPQMWMEYFDAFTRNQTVADKENLAVAKNSTDVSHMRYYSVLPNPEIKRRRLLSFRGHDIASIRYAWNDGVYCRTLTLFGRIPLYRKRTKVFSMDTIAAQIDIKRNM